ncbi:hypothetical protein PVAR5_1750 [Paecilomyces variotii No. 5]|uniref:Uncharacterized protein n=1 Tax=Byssochlamys spectabilis (strain No. 5 / NBRC 109023) TaxID=1356009 RepID=V5HU78_BYSSN|nr:hypothetical protein PVAR5_1750 [Paecilomyces variotii No. 5]
MTALLHAASLVLVGVLLTFFHYWHRSAVLKSAESNVGTGPELVDPSKTRYLDDEMSRETQSYKTLYHRVQNLEAFPEILPTARKTLLSLLRQGVVLARLQNGQRNVLNITDYDPDQLATFMAAKRQDTHDEWSAYLRRREAGGGAEMFVDREAARQWLKMNAPLQLVDGAWVARVHNATTPFPLRRITKDAWQTYCEELGDGELEKNHCFIYRELLREVGWDFPDQNVADFIHPRHGLGNDRIWRAGAGHLLISLFPNDFLPEILGFNLHYESLAPQTLMAARELPEFGISGYYFAVHICIDNADSGHSAMAEATIRSYMEHVRRTAGTKEAQHAWKRVQAGFLLSEYLDGDEDLNKYREKVADMLHSKAGVAGRLHCSSRARVGGRTLTEWFSPQVLSSVNSRSWKTDFVAALARSKPWVYPGDSERGLLVRALSWKGRMFGAFTHAETQCLRAWIDLLDDDDDAADSEAGYWKLIGRSDDGRNNSTLLQDAAVIHPAFPPQREQPLAAVDQDAFVPLPPLHVPQFKLEALLPLWFMHPCILEQIVMSPYRTSTPLGSLVLQILRAESGYVSESSGIAGMDEQRQPGDHPSLTALGLQMIGNNGMPEPTCLKDAFKDGSSPAAVDFAYVVLSWAARPISNLTFLFGLARAFVDLEAWVSCNEVLLRKEEREALKKLVERKRILFEEILTEIKGEAGQIGKFIAAYEYGRMQIENLLV